MYSEIKSEFVKNELKKTAWKDREYIDRLMDIEKFATTGYCSTGAGYMRKFLIEKYPTQWEKIYLELNPKRYKEILSREKIEREKDKKEEARYRKEEKESLQWQKEEWKKTKEN